MERRDAGEEDWARVIAARALARAERRRGAIRALAERMRAEARRMAARLGAEPGVRQVVLFGSLAGAGGVVHEHSDIDLAVEGLPAEREAAVAWELAGMTDAHLDLVRLEDACVELRRRIEEMGEVLHVAG